MKDSSELRLCDWQLTICHEYANKFKIGDKVFMKGSHHVEQVVYSIDNNNNKVIAFRYHNNEEEYITLPPQCFIQKEYACFVSYKKKYDFCLN